MRTFIEQTLNGFSFAALLFLLGSGFALTFGLMRMVNLGHGAIYLIGGYVGWSTINEWGGNFWLALLAGAGSTLVLGWVLERFLLRRLHGQETSELLLTMGFAFIAADLALTVWGGDPLSIKTPDFLAGSTTIGSITYPNIRFFTIVCAVVIGVALFLMMSRSKLGATVRAGVDNREMVSALGVNIQLVFTLVFVLGAALAGLAGVLGGSLLTLAPGSDSEILVFALVVVIIGGRGTIEGAMAGSLIVGLLDTYGKAYFPELSYFSIFVPMVLILLWRPQGLFGRAAVA
jgi:branched-chain amino acid transport system permease protein